METNMKEKSLKHKIKEMENAQRSSAPVSGTLEEKLSFDHWWILLNMRMSLKPHLKEILWAEFRSRGLKKVETAAKYDEGLKLFGL
jgi:hypothetical protein